MRMLHCVTGQHTLDAERRHSPARSAILYAAKNDGFYTEIDGFYTEIDGFYTEIDGFGY